MARTWTPSQEVAMNLRDKTLLVSAAAGSGKTSVLTERIIRSLLDPAHPADLSKMLVVTFTRAAAAELKSRIAEALSAALAANPGDKHLSSQLFLLGSAQISTIDSFFQKIVRSNFDALGLPASFRIASESEIKPIAMELLDALITEFYEQNEPNTPQSSHFDRILKNRFAASMDHLMTNRSDGKLDKLLLEFLDTVSAYPDGIELLKKNAEQLRQESRFDFLKSRYGIALSASLREQYQGDLAELQKIKAYLDTDPDVNAKLGGMVASDRDYCQAMLNALEEQCYDHVKAVSASFGKGRFPTIRDKANEVIRYQGWRNKFKARQDTVAGYFQFSPEEITRQAEETAALCEVLYRFYSVYSARLLQEKKTRGVLEFNDVRTLLYRLLSTSDGAPSELAKNLADQFDAVYIDEYQDVDFVQDSIFAILGGTRRFMVGDIKQSIYGFRGSEPSIFADYRRKMPLHDAANAADADGNCVFMSDNFRCDQPVIDFTNAICGFLFSACEKSIQYRKQDDLICAKPKPEAPLLNHPVPVQVAFFDKTPRGYQSDDEDEDAKDEALWVAAEISRLLREEQLDNGKPIKPSDIAILIRSKKQMTPFQKELEALNIPFRLTASSDILQDPLTVEMFNLLKAIDNPYRDIPLSEFLLSPLGGFSLEELTEIRKAAPESKALYEAMECLARSEAVSLLSKKSTVLLEWMERQRQNATSQPADKFLRTLYLEERLLPYSQQPPLLFLYEQARLYQKTSWCGLYGFLQHFEKLTESGTASAGGFLQEEDAVSIMTVHHSKGLEYPVVFLSACGTSFNKSDLKETLVYHKNLGLATKLYSPISGDSEDSIFRMAVKNEINAEQTEEHIRTLYVALTRARERLCVTGTLGGLWENACQAASLIERGNRTDILGCNSYLAWILAALQQEEAKKAEFPCTFRHFSLKEAQKGVPFDPQKRAEEEPEKERAANPVSLHYANIMQAAEQFEYPHSLLHGLPTKAAASKLQQNLLDIQDEESTDRGLLEAQITLMESAPKSFSALLQRDSRPSAAEIGTATHAFLEFCDFRRLADSGVEAEITRLIEHGFLHPHTADIIHKKQLSLFCQSDLMNWILNASKIYREQKFGLHIPMKELTSDSARQEALGDQTIFVQGSIDLLLETHEKQLVLIDYKTDRVTEAERNNLALLAHNLKMRHNVQLSYYAKAVRALFGKEPDKICIYSVPIGKAIDISLF